MIYIRLCNFVGSIGKLFQKKVCGNLFVSINCLFLCKQSKQMNSLTQKFDAMQQLQVNSFVFGFFQVDESVKARYRVVLNSSFGISKDMIETDNLQQAKSLALEIAADAASYPKFCKVSIVDTERIRWGWYLQFDDMLVREYDHTR